MKKSKTWLLPLGIILLGLAVWLVRCRYPSAAKTALKKPVAVCGRRP